jgi:putative endonuclease
MVGLMEYHYCVIIRGYGEMVLQSYQEFSMEVDKIVWFLYTVRCSDNTLYTGVTTNPDRRLKEHNESNRGSKYTKSRRPVDDMVLLGWFIGRSRAQKAEYKFKKLTREQKEKIINESR